MKHLTREQFEHFVMGVEREDDEGFRRHLRECPECARRLREESALELLLLEHGATRAPETLAGSRRPALPAVWRVVLPAAAVLVAVAAVWLARPPVESPAPRAARAPATDVAESSASPVALRARPVLDGLDIDPGPTRTAPADGVVPIEQN